MTIKMVETIKEALVELEAKGVVSFHGGYITPKEWKTSYAPELRAAFPECWWVVDSLNHITVSAE